MDNIETSGPRTTSLLLFTITLAANAAHYVTHAEVNAWLATAAGVLSIDHYIGFGIVGRMKRLGQRVIKHAKTKW